jgi:hypothetical protein
MMAKMTNTQQSTERGSGRNGGDNGDGDGNSDEDNRQGQQCVLILVFYTSDCG